MKDFRILLFGIHFLLAGYFLMVMTCLLYIVSYFLPAAHLSAVFCFWICVAAFLTFVLLAVINIIFGKISILHHFPLRESLEGSPNICVVMTAYNDEASIGDAVCDFKNRTGVSRVVVIDNNSIDATALRARESGALVVSEPVQGYGAACICALRQGLLTECDIVCLVEGDGTFSGVDLAKLVAYASNADMVLGTRTTKELTSPDSQMNWLMRLGNVFMAKLLQVRFWHVRLTDMGCTYRLIRQNALRRMIDKLSITGNEFLCEMTLTALRENLKTIEIPVSLRKRVGISKGVGGNIPKAVAVGLKMWKLILFR